MNELLAQAIASYHPNQHIIDLVRQTPTLLLVGISGAGKDTIKHELLKTGAYHHIVSHTTRLPRSNAGVLETNGREYHFIDTATAEQLVADQKFVEAKLVHGTIYGTSAAEFEQATAERKIALTDIDVQGAAEYKNLSENVVAIFVLPPDYTEWQRRLCARYGAAGPDATELATRMKTAITELEAALARPYYHFIINDDLARAVKAADSIAHGRDSFNEKDTAVRHQAEALLTALREHLA